jgi:filamentous hemagglutinin
LIFKNVDDILKPGGQFVGTVHKGATPDIRTVSSSDFDALRIDLLDGATVSGTYAGGKGTWYDLPGGGRVGLRMSDNSGATLDIDIPGYPKGFKVHQQ